MTRLPACGVAVLVLWASAFSGVPANAQADREALATTGTSKTLRQAIGSLAVKPKSHLASYDRQAQFGDWIEQGGGCDTRAVVLKTESLAPTTQNSNCTVSNGKWYSFYDAKTYYNAYGGTVQIDHVVPVDDVWASGAWSWTQATRVRYYNDLGDARTLVAVDAHDNESKGAQTPDGWMPPKGRCRYVKYFVAVKARWNLSITSAEKSTLLSWADRCGNPEITIRRASIDYR